MIKIMTKKARQDLYQEGYDEGYDFARDEMIAVLEEEF